jgi:oligopeptide transport system ATP-binding protein
VRKKGQEAIPEHEPRSDVLVEVEGLRKWFEVTGGVFNRLVGHVKAVDGVSFYIKPGETLGLVGESGCGKTTTGRVILRLMEPTAGTVYFEGRKIFDLDREEMRRLRRQMQIVFQDPYSSLNPRMTVGAIVGEALEIHGVARGRSKEKRVQELLDVVGLNPNHISRYPHEFSGGQRQRIGVARALALNPKLIICDEPVSALDVSIQSHILNLLEDLQSEFNLTYLFIAHNLSVVRHISDRVGVMYLGQMVELCPAEELFENPLHPYTEALMSAIPLPDPEFKRGRIILEGDVPSPMNPPDGCHFHTRCRFAHPICGEVAPPFIDVGDEHFVGCHLRKTRVKQ